MKLLFTISCVIFGLTIRAQTLTIISVKKLNYTDTTKDKTIVSRFEHYLVRGYKGNKTDVLYIDNFIKRIPPNNFKKYTRYTITIFKESHETNIHTIDNYLKNNANPFYGKDDLIFEYSWENGAYIGKYGYKNGKLKESKFAGTHVQIKSLVVDSAQCDFLKDLKFKNRRDTVVVKAVLRDFLLAPPRLLLKKTPSIYKYRFGSNIMFQPENCDHNYSMPIISSKWADPDDILNGDNLGLTVYLTCVVFNESTLNRGQPDCLVIKIKPAIQSQIAFPQRCNFLPDLHFRNGVDTAIITAKYHAIFGKSKGLILSELNKKHLLTSGDYEKSIGFQVPGCDETIIAPYHFKNNADEELLNKQPDETPIQLTCVVFKNYYSFGMPFFVIKRLKISK